MMLNENRWIMFLLVFFLFLIQSSMLTSQLSGRSNLSKKLERQKHEITYHNDLNSFLKNIFKVKNDLESIDQMVDNEKRFKRKLFSFDDVNDENQLLKKKCCDKQKKFGEIDIAKRENVDGYYMNLSLPKRTDDYYSVSHQNALFHIYNQRLWKDVIDDVDNDVGDDSEKSKLKMKKSARKRRQRKQKKMLIKRKVEERSKKIVDLENNSDDDDDDGGGGGGTLKKCSTEKPIYQIDNHKMKKSIDSLNSNKTMETVSEITDENENLSDDDNNSQSVESNDKQMDLSTRNVSSKRNEKRKLAGESDDSITSDSTTEDSDVDDDGLTNRLLPMEVSNASSSGSDYHALKATDDMFKGGMEQGNFGNGFPNPSFQKDQLKSKGPQQSKNQRNELPKGSESSVELNQVPKQFENTLNSPTKLTENFKKLNKKSPAKVKKRSYKVRKIDTLAPGTKYESIMEPLNWPLDDETSRHFGRGLKQTTDDYSDFDDDDDDYFNTPSAKEEKKDENKHQSTHQKYPKVLTQQAEPLNYHVNQNRRNPSSFFEVKHFSPSSSSPSSLKKYSNTSFRRLKKQINSTVGKFQIKNSAHYSFNNFSDESQMHLAINGILPDKIVNKIFEQVDSNNDLKINLRSGLNRKHFACSHSHGLKLDNENRTNINKTNAILRGVKYVLQYYLKSETHCKQLPKYFKSFLIWMVTDSKNDHHDVASFKNPLVIEDEKQDGNGQYLFTTIQTPQKLNSLESTKYSRDLYNSKNSPIEFHPSLDELQDKIQLLQDLTQQYNHLNSNDQSKVQNVNNYLERHLDFLEKFSTSMKENSNILNELNRIESFSGYNKKRKRRYEISSKRKINQKNINYREKRDIKFNGIVKSTFNNSNEMENTLNNETNIGLNWNKTNIKLININKKKNKLLNESLSSLKELSIAHSLNNNVNRSLVISKKINNTKIINNSVYPLRENFNATEEITNNQGNKSKTLFQSYDSDNPTSSLSKINLLTSTAPPLIKETLKIMKPSYLNESNFDNQSIESYHRKLNVF